MFEPGKSRLTFPPFPLANLPLPMISFRKQRDIFEVKDFRFPSRRHRHFDDVEPEERWLAPQLFQVFAKGPAQRVFLRFIDGVVSRNEGSLGSGFDLDENQHFPIPANEVDLVLLATPVTRDHTKVFFPPQEGFGRLLSLSPRHLLFGLHRWRPVPAEPLQERGYPHNGLITSALRPTRCQCAGRATALPSPGSGFASSGTDPSGFSERQSRRGCS